MEVAQETPFTDIPGNDPSMGARGTTIGPVRVTLKEAIAAFAPLPVYAFAGTEIVEVGIDAAELYP